MSQVLNVDNYLTVSAKFVCSNLKAPQGALFPDPFKLLCILQETFREGFIKKWEKAANFLDKSAFSHNSFGQAGEDSLIGDSKNE